MENDCGAMDAEFFYLYSYDFIRDVQILRWD